MLIIGVKKNIFEHFLDILFELLNILPFNSPPIYIRQKKTIGIGLKLILQQKSEIEKENLCLYGQSHSLPG